MPTADQARIAEDRAKPRLMELWWALQPLKSVVRFMQTGAHPDDEISGMLAALAFRDGINISYACSTRGEGGQNDIGTEAGFDLGALRTREMERACDVLGMRMYWHGATPEDTITDFGFSKSGDETLGRWGHDRTLARFVEIVRTDKPDIICPTFLDVPGQHGHHRAMTQAAHEVMSAAANPGFPSNLPPWQVKKMYLPAWSGAGTSYDDDLPPPPATLAIPGTDTEPMTGWAWDRIGQQSRAYHRTQGMGRWVPAGPGHDWPLHLAESHVEGPDDALWSGLPRTIGDLAAICGAVKEPLLAAQSAVDRAIEAFPDFASVTKAASEALEAIRAAQSDCPPDAQAELSHRLEAKSDQLVQVLRLSLGVDVRAYTKAVFLDAGGATDLTIEHAAGAAESLSVELDLPDGWSVVGETVSVASDTALHDAYRDRYDPIVPPTPRLMAEIGTNGLTCVAPVAWDAEPVVLPKARLTFDRSALVLNRAAPGRALDLAIRDLIPSDASVELDLPAGWQAGRTDTGFALTAPDDVAPGVYSFRALVNGMPGQTVRTITHDHVAPTARARPAEVRVAAVDIAVPEGRVGYIGAGNDRVGHWLAAMGADVTDLSDAELGSDAALDAFGAIVIGIFAMRFRPGLLQAMPRLHRWTEAGGTLVTLYHRPWDNWDPDRVPPKRLEIGQPSLRWRVTDEAAEVTHLADHPVLQRPNPIGPSDWAGWVKERGLYFAKSWDSAYVPLLSMADPDEDPLTGSLLVADIGQGRHIHTSLILHHQLENLVPGAFRLMANFIAPRE